MFESGRYSDLTIVCGNKRYPVHRALLASRSTFFDGACRNSFREAETGVIDLSEDDPEAVEHMVHCRCGLWMTPNAALTDPDQTSTISTISANRYLAARLKDQPRRRDRRAFPHGEDQRNSISR